MANGGTDRGTEGRMEGWTEEWIEGRTEGQMSGNSPCVLQDIGPLGPLLKKGKEIRVD